MPNIQTHAAQGLYAYFTQPVMNEGCASFSEGMAAC